MNYFEEENKITKKLFNLDEILEFQLKHDLQIIRGEDYQYGCYINKECYTNSLTPLNAIVTGIKIFKKLKENDNRKD